METKEMLDQNPQYIISELCRLALVRELRAAEDRRLKLEITLLERELENLKETA